MAVTSGGEFRLSVFDPILIVGQIVTIQCLWYLSLGLLILVSVPLFASSHLPSLDLLLSHKQFTGSLGLIIVLCFLVNSLAGYVFVKLPTSSPSNQYPF